MMFNTVENRDLFGEAILTGETVDGVVGLAHAADGATDGERLGWSFYKNILKIRKNLVRAEHATGLWVNVAEVDLDRGLVLGADQAVWGGALARDVQVDNFALIVLHGLFS